MYPQTCCSSQTTGHLLWPGREGCKTSWCCSRGTSSFFHQRWWREGRNLSRRAEARCVDEGYQDDISAPDRLDQSLCPSPVECRRNTEFKFTFICLADTKRLAVHSSYTFYQFIHTMGIFLVERHLIRLLWFICSENMEFILSYWFF